MGSRRKNCGKGVESLIATERVDLISQSSIYKTEPVDYKDQEWFVNYVIQIATRLDPFSLLDRIRQIQKAAGRLQDSIRYGPRILDMDILIYDDAVINASDLIVPHPRMHQRRFVLQPLCDIEPMLIHPVLKQPMKALLDNLDTAEQRIIQIDD
jgi:2-amino-4-hydroxy-6-hydroxymethyldihydropteridine diphosphokinase